MKHPEPKPKPDHDKEPVLTTSRTLLIVLLCMTLVACETVQPWQRGTLARPDMQLDEDPLATRLADQVYASKEASSGSASPAGAGCGCN